MADFIEFFNGFVNTAKEQIKELANEEIENTEKKAKLDTAIGVFIETTLAKAKLNIFVKLCIKKLVIPHVAEITQVVYDLLKAKINGVTDETKSAKGSKGNKEGAE